MRLAVTDPTDRPAPGSDAALLAEGFATLTALRSIAEDPSVPVEDMLHHVRTDRENVMDSRFVRTVERGPQERRGSTNSHTAQLRARDCAADT